MFENFGVGTLLMIGLAAVIGFYLHKLEKKEKSDTSAALSESYKHLSAEMLCSLSDVDIVRAVAANLLAKTDRRHPDVYHLFPMLSHGRMAVYSVWLICQELATTDLPTLLTTPTTRFIESAAEGFAWIGADACATALLAAVNAPEDEACCTALYAAIADEQPLILCATYIREHLSEFTDT